MILVAGGAAMTHNYASSELNWNGDRLCLGDREIVRVIRDAAYPRMWRVRKPDHRLTDMVNKTRAKDAAYGYALGALNEGRGQPLRRGVDAIPAGMAAIHRAVRAHVIIVEVAA